MFWMSDFVTLPCRDLDHPAFAAEYARHLLDAMHNDPTHNATWDLFWRAHPGPDGTFTPEVGAGAPPAGPHAQARAALPLASMSSATRVGLAAGCCRHRAQRRSMQAYSLAGAGPPGQPQRPTPSRCEEPP